MTFVVKKRNLRWTTLPRAEAILALQTQFDRRQLDGSTQETMDGVLLRNNVKRCWHVARVLTSDLPRSPRG